MQTIHQDMDKKVKKTEREAEMISWLNQHFEITDPQSKSKVTVEEVKVVFNHKYPGETNNTFGSIVRKAFPCVQRARDSVSYYYRPLRWKIALNDQCSHVGVTTTTQTPQPQDPSMKLISSSEVTQLESANLVLKSQVSQLETTNLGLKSQVAQLETTKLALKSKVAQLETTNLGLKSKVAQLETTNLGLKSQVAQLETTNLDLKSQADSKLKDAEEAARLAKETNESLMRQLSELKAKNKKQEVLLGKRRWTEATNDGKDKHKRNKMMEVKKINSNELTGGKEEVIGEGSFGRCLLRTFVRTGMVVVVKEMKRDSYQSLIREAQIMQSLESDRFPFIFGVQMTEQPFSIVMQFIGNPELMKSATLYQVVADKEDEIYVNMRNSMSKLDWIKVCEDMTEGIQHLHSSGFLHNDLKNNNVLIDRKRAFIIDLGKACDASTPPAKKYTNFYSHIAPEVIQGHCCSYESDIYSLGQLFNFIRKFCSLVELRSIEKECTSSNHVMRPAASYVAAKLNALSSTIN